MFLFLLWIILNQQFRENSVLKNYLLFDIDGTLINTGGAGLRAMKTTVKNILGNEDLLTGYSFAGKTDAQIMNDMVRRSGLDDKLEEMSKLFAQNYIENLKTNLENSDNFGIYPNVNDLLDKYQKMKVLNSLSLPETSKPAQS